MLSLPDFVRADAATLLLIVLATVTGELPRASFDAAWDAWPGGPDGYTPTVEVEGWVRENWRSLTEMPRSGEILADVGGEKSSSNDTDSLTNLTARAHHARDWMPKFLSKLRRKGIVSHAAAAAGITRQTAYACQKAYPEFAALWALAEEEAADRLEAEAWRRGHHGVDKTVYGRVDKDQDGEIGIERHYSDTLLLSLLKARRPGKFREKGGDTNVNVNASASASATAITVVIPPEKLKGIQERNRLQLEKQAARALKASAGGN